MSVMLRLSRRRCLQQQCERQTFAYLLQTVASSYARRPKRAVELVGLLGRNTDGHLGERPMQRLGMPVSEDTISRNLKQGAAVANGAIEI